MKPTNGSNFMSQTRLILTIAGVLAIPVTLAAQPSPDTPAAIVIFPHVSTNTASGIDTVVQLSNTSNRPANVSCFYLTADAACSPTSFEVNITRNQPISWRIGNGLTQFPLDGRGSQSNDGSLIPPVPNDPFEGSLLCWVHDANGIPLPRNALIGTATIERFKAGMFDAASYNAIGIGGLANTESTPGSLVLGGTFGTYAPCTRILEAVHYLDGALDAPTKTSHVATRFVILPCTLDLSQPAEQQLSMQYEVVNEFEERLAVRREQVGCEQQGFLSSINTSIPGRSIFNAAVAGTLTAKTRIYANDGAVGLVAIALETHTKVNAPAAQQLTAFSFGTVGRRLESDVITFPGIVYPPPCKSDCDLDWRVTVDEVMLCVDIGLGAMPRGACTACDGDGNLSVSINEIVGAVDRALNGCPL